MTKAKRMLSLAKRIVSILEVRGKSQAWLAKRAQCSRSTICRVISGQRKPTIETITCISLGLGVPFDELIKGTEWHHLQIHSNDAAYESTIVTLRKQIEKLQLDSVIYRMDLRCALASADALKQHLIEALKKPTI